MSLEWSNLDSCFDSPLQETSPENSKHKNAQLDFHHHQSAIEDDAISPFIEDQGSGALAEISSQDKFEYNPHFSTSDRNDELTQDTAQNFETNSRFNCKTDMIPTSTKPLLNNTMNALEGLDPETLEKIQRAPQDVMDPPSQDKSGKVVPNTVATISKPPLRGDKPASSVIDNIQQVRKPRTLQCSPTRKLVENFSGAPVHAHAIEKIEDPRWRTAHHEVGEKERGGGRGGVGEVYEEDNFWTVFLLVFLGALFLTSSRFHRS